jgi:hypothetical protein
LITRAPLLLIFLQFFLAHHLANCRHAEQPWMILHELSHAYHYGPLGSQRADLLQAYQAALHSRTYDNVLHVNGSRMRHYAMTNHLVR